MVESPGKLIAIAVIAVLGLAGGWQALQERRAADDESALPFTADGEPLSTLPPASGSMISATVYHDPNGRFSIQVPEGWQATPELKGLVMKRGNTAVTVSPFSGATSAQHIVSVLAEQYMRNWQNLQPLDQGEFLLAGTPAAYALFRGTNPRGDASMLRLAGTMRDGEGFAVIMNVPMENFNDARATLQAIEGSVTLGRR